MDIVKLQQIANSYIGTPFVNTGRIKGVGVDCCTLPKGIFEELTGKEFPMPTVYSAGWYCKKNCKELMLPYLESYCDKVDDLQDGDIISFRWGRAEYAHLAVYLGDGIIIHCKAGEGVEYTELTNPDFYDAKGESRITGYWRVKE